MEFQMTVEDVFSIRGRGTVVTGRVEAGVVRVGDEIYIRSGGQKAPIRTKVAAIEIFAKQLKEAHAGEIVGILLQGVTKEDVQRGHVLTHAGYHD